MAAMRRLAPLAAALALCAACAGAAAAAGPGARARPLVALDALSPPPAAGSDESKADLAIVLWEQRTRSQEDVERSRREVGLGLEAFAGALGPGFDAPAHPRTAALLDRAHAAATPIVGDAKARWRRPRPSDADPRVHSAVEREDTFSYPSSHGVRGVLIARILAELAPSRWEALLAAGRRVGWDRVTAGAHYPSDVVGGQQLGEAIAAALLADPSFRAELEAARVEWPAP